MPAIELNASPPMCEVDHTTSDQPCLRVAQWRWKPEDEHPVDLCHFHAEPLIASDPAMVDGWFGKREDWRD